MGVVCLLIRVGETGGASIWLAVWLVGWLAVLFDEEPVVLCCKDRLPLYFMNDQESAMNTQITSPPPPFHFRAACR